VTSLQNRQVCYDGEARDEIVGEITVDCLPNRDIFHGVSVQFWYTDVEFWYTDVVQSKEFCNSMQEGGRMVS
jgi:hypothetical protein